MKLKIALFILIIFSFFISSIGAEKILDAPTCEITAPTDGAEFDFGDFFRISVDASDPNGNIDSVLFYVDSVLQHTDYNPPFEHTWNTVRNTIGDRFVKVIAYDNEGLSAADSITVQVSLNGVKQYTYEVIKEYTHDYKAYTQGLVWEDDSLYEGTGQWGESSLRRVHLETGNVSRQIDLSSSYFGEGIVIYQDKIIQLTYKADIAFVYNKYTFEQLDSFYYSTNTSEGWGITYDGKKLIVSDGGSYLQFWDTLTYEEIDEIRVREDGSPLTSLNELEFFYNKVFANVFTESYIVMIDLASGDIVGKLECSGLLSSSKAGVLNGIAYDKDNDRIFVTGKDWPKLFEIKLVPEPITYSINLSTDGNGSTNPQNNIHVIHNVESGDISANANEYYNFTNWTIESGDITITTGDVNSETINITATSAGELRAHFEQTSGMSVDMDSASPGIQAEIVTSVTGEQFTIEIRGHDLSNVRSYECNLQFDHTEFEYVSAAESNSGTVEDNFLLENGAPQTFFQIATLGADNLVFTNTIVEEPPTIMANGDGILAVVTFNSLLAAGVSGTFQIIAGKTVDIGLNETTISLFNDGTYRVNAKPLITEQATLSTSEETALKIELGDLTVTDVDNTYPDDFTLTVGAGTNYTVNGATITPAVDFNGDLTVPVTVNDGFVDSDPFDLTVTVTQVNDAPEIISGSPLGTAEDAPITVTLADVAVTDVDNIPADFTFTVLRVDGNATVSGNEVSPALNYNGDIVVTVQVDDGEGENNLSNEYPLTLTVTAVNDAPVLAAIGAQSTAEGALLEFTASATDPDGQSVTITASGLPTGADFDGTAFSWTPDYDAAASSPYSVTFTASDGDLTDEEIVEITVTNTNRAPVLEAIGAKSTAEGTLLEFTASATDPDGQSVTITASGLPTGADFDGTAFSWTPDYDAAASSPYSVTFTASDGDLTDAETIEITVTDVSYTVTFIEASNGSITGTLIQTVNPGGSCTEVTAVPDSGYSFKEWTGDCTGCENPLTITNVILDMTVTANFDIASSITSKVPFTSKTIFFIYPNPVNLNSGQLHFSFRTNKNVNAHLIIYDCVGNTVFKDDYFIEANMKNSRAIFCAWNLKNNNLRKVSIGTYLAILKIKDRFGNTDIHKKVIGVKEH